MIAASARRLDGARQRLTAQRELWRLRELLPPLLDGTPAAGRLDGARRAQWTQSGVAVYVLEATEDAPATVVKATWRLGAATSLARQHATLEQLRAITALGEWRTLLPRPLAQREAGNLRVFVESALPGRSAVDARCPGSLTHFLASLAPLRLQTGGTVAVGARQLTRWIDEPLERVATLDCLSATQRMTLAALGARMTNELLGADLRTGWIHGDYWPANLLVDEAGVVTGIVDWDRAAPDELALHDSLHLLLYTRKLRLRQPLGVIVARQLREPVWSAEEQRALTALPDDDATVTDANALTLYWLRHVAENLRRDPNYAANAAWLRGNVLPVLDALDGVT